MNTPVIYSGKGICLMLVAPLPPPSGGIASWTVQVLGYLRSCKDVRAIHVDTGVRWRHVNNKNTLLRIAGGTAQSVGLVARILSVSRSSHPQVMHLCSSASLATVRDMVILLLARRLRMKSVIHYRMGRIPAVMRHGGLEWRLMRWAIRIADAVMVLDEESEQCILRGIPGAKVFRIHNPIDVDRVKAVVGEGSSPMAHKDRLNRVVFAGHVLPDKGVRELVAACGALGCEDVELHLVGSISEGFRRELLSLARGFGKGAWLRIHGPVSWEDTIRWISDADIVVLPSYTEGFPNVILEAMCLGKPIVATGVGAVPEMLGIKESRQCGIVVPPRCVEELRTAIAFLRTHPEHALELGARARERLLREYTMENTMGRYLNVWNHLARGLGGRS